MSNVVLIPDPLNSDMEYTRFHHLDIPDLDDTKLLDELNYLRARLWNLPPQHWLRERANVLEHELAKRKWGTKSKS
jgi:hypothetical protein